MLPCVWPGDVLTIVGDATNIVAGDIVLVLCGDRVIVHRFIGRHNSPSFPVWITKGDSNPDNDPPAADSCVLGRVVSIRRGGRDFTPERELSRIQSMVALLASRSDRFRSILLRLYARGKELASSQNTSAASFRTMQLSADDCDGRSSCP